VIKFGRSFWWLLTLIGVSFLLTRIPELASNPIYTRLLVTLLIILFVNAIWAGFSLTGINISRKSRISRKQVGEIFTENFELHNRSIIPKIWLKITDQAALSGVAGSRIITWLGSQQNYAYLAYSLLENRGWFTLSPTTIESGDIFGLFLIRKTFQSYSRLLIIPHTFDVKGFPSPFGNLPGGRALRQKTLEVTPYAAGVREFVPGDPLKRIHWPSSARQQKLIVKEFEKDPLAEVWIFIDAQADMHVKTKVPDFQSAREYWLVKYSWMKKSPEYALPKDTEEYAISIAASLAKYYIQQSREVGLVSAGQNYSILPAERGERQLGKVLETLAVVQAKGEIPFWHLVSSQISHLARGTTMILITPSNDEKLLTVVMDLIQRGLMPVVILIDQSSFGCEEDVSLLEEKFTAQGIMTFVVRYGDDLSKALGSSKFTIDSRIMYRRV
jgi:uncharacterized protein (DUF58 family)